jgi:hypothetical protein
MYSSILGSNSVAIVLIYPHYDCDKYIYQLFMELQI